MADIFRWLLRIASGLIVLAVLAVVMIYYLASRSLPDYDATLGVPYLTAPVEIVRDSANVPHIFGEADADVFYALGYAHAQDRLWQMMMMRRTVQGRLSEVFGPATLNIDQLMRRLDLYPRAVASLEVQDDRTMMILDAYATGVNARLDQVNQQALGRGAPEMFLFNAPTAPWRPADSLAIVKLMGLQLSGHLDAEVMRARMSLALPDPERIRDILPEAPGSGVAALPEYAHLFPNVTRFAETVPLDPHPLAALARELRGLLAARLQLLPACLGKLGKAVTF